MPTAEERRAFRARVAAAQAARTAGAEAGRPFLIVTPLGAPAVIGALVADAGVEIAERVRLPAWPAASTAVHVRWTDDAGLDKAQAFEQLWAGYPDRAELWWLTDDVSYQRLLAAKPALRARLADAAVAITTDRFVGSLFPFHVPDRARLDDETRVVRWWLAR